MYAGSGCALNGFNGFNGSVEAFHLHQPHLPESLGCYSQVPLQEKTDPLNPLEFVVSETTSRAKAISVNGNNGYIKPIGAIEFSADSVSG